MRKQKVKAQPDDLPQSWPAWTKQIMDECERAEGKYPDLYSEGAPEWVIRIWARLISTLFSRVKFKKDVSGPAFVGSLIGHHERFLNGDDGLMSALHRSSAQAVILEKRITAKLDKKQLIQWKECCRRFLADFTSIVEEKKRLVGRSLAIAGEQESAERQEFFAAYTAASKTPIFNEQGNLARDKSSSATRIYFLIAVNWRKVQQLGTVGNLHKWLGTIVPGNLLGDIDRTKWICREFKIKLAERGRPRKKMRG